MGTLSAIGIGQITHGLGCGRKTPASPIKYHPGIILRKKVGDPVSEGDVILEVHHDDEDVIPMKLLRDAVEIVVDPPPKSELVIKLIE